MMMIMMIRIMKNAIYLIAIILIIGEASAGNVVISPSSLTVNQGQNFIVNVSIDPTGSPIAGAQSNLIYNSSAIQINSITEGNLFIQNGASTVFSSGTINNSQGTVINIYTAILGPYNVSSTGTFITINATSIVSSGTYKINISNAKVSDPGGILIPMTITNGSVTINNPPVLAAIGNKISYPGQTLNFIVSAADANGDTLTYSATNLPSGASFNPATRTFVWTPSQTGVYNNVRFEVSDGLVTVFENITIYVNNNVNISVSPSSKKVNQGQTFDLNIIINPQGTAISGAQMTLAFNKSIVNVNSITEGNIFKQNGANTLFNSGVINNSLGTVTNIYTAIIGANNISTQGTFIAINVTAIGSSGTSGINLSKIIVSDPTANATGTILTNGSIVINSPPVLTAIGNKVVNEGEVLSVTISANDANGDALTYSASNLPAGAAFNPSNRTLTWIPGYNQSGIYPNVHFEVTDGSLIAFENITITVNNVNRPPTFSITPLNGSTFNETDTIIISVSASDPDNDSLNYTIRIDGVQVATVSSYIWVTNYSSSGIHNINVSVSDGTVTVTSTITLNINNVHPRYDVDENGVVNIQDITIIGQHFEEKVTSPYPRYDVNMDGVIDIADLTITAQHFGENT